MKIRTGFISNSSSSCFILDYRNPEVKGLVERCLASSPDGTGRSTAIAVREDVQLYGSELIDYGWGGEDLGTWIYEWIEKLGIDNIVFMRESDEEMGGILFEDEKDYDILKKYTLEERDYH